MERIYANLIISGRKNINDVPEVIVEQVKAILIQEGYEIREDGTVIKIL